MYITKRIDDDSYPKLKLLIKKSFGINTNLSDIKAKFDTNTFNLKNIGILAETENEEPVAYYGVFPLILSYKSNEYLVAQSGDTMTIPTHQKKGLFVKLAQLTYQLAKQEGIQLVFGFPNENSYHGFKTKLNWVFNDSLQKFTIKNSVIPFCEIAFKFNFFEPIYRKYVQKKLSKIIIELDDNTISCFNKNTSVGYIKKDVNFFKYKLNIKNNYLITINGFTLLIKTKTHLKIGLVAWFEEKRIDDFINVVQKLAKIVGSRKTILIMSKNHWLYKYLVDIIKPEKNCPIGFYEISDTIDYKNIEFVYADNDTF